MVSFRGKAGKLQTPEVIKWKSVRDPVQRWNFSCLSHEKGAVLGQQKSFPERPMLHPT